MITDLNELFSDIENRIGRMMTQTERLAIRAEVVINTIPKGKRTEDIAKAVADRIIREERQINEK